MKTSQILPVLIFLFSFYGCVSSNRIYTPPPAMPVIKNSVELNQSKDAIWNKLVRGIGTQFFVINNMDKQSGFLNISYSGDPEKFVSGGELTFYFKNLRGERNYTFPASRAQAQYETMINNVLCVIARKLELDGRMNILVNEIDSLHTSVSVNTQYVLTLSASGYDARGNTLVPHQETISFNTGQSAKSSGGTLFYSNGEFEKAILELIVK